MKFEFDDRSKLTNVVPFNVAVEMVLPLSLADREVVYQDLAEESEDGVPEMISPKFLVRAEQFPDQSMHVLDMQMNQLREKMDRLKFYLSDVEDLIPRQV